jgi:hypothetical protein
VQTTVIRTELQTDGGQLDLVLSGGVALRDVVRISASGTVDKADTTGIDRYGIGVISRTNFPSAGRGFVTTHGIVDGFVGLIPNKRYILSRFPGVIVAVDDTGNINYPQPGEFLQFVGFGITSTQLFVTISPILLDI